MKSKSAKFNTQKYLPFKEIKEGVITMKDGSHEVVLMVNSINFNLKSEDEQLAILDMFKNFLNSLDFPLQILIQSRILDLDDYLKNLDQLGTNQANELLQLHTKEYIEFIKELIGLTNVMHKTFYVVISDKNIPTQQSLLAKLFSAKPTTPLDKFQEIHSHLLNTASLVANGLASMGLHSILLNTKELIDLFYATYNLDIARRQKLFNVSSVDATIITALAKSKTPEK